MAFVKLDCGMIDSTLWFDREGREVFITALLMAMPWETSEPVRQIAVGKIEYTGFEAPPGRYGFVHAAGPGIVSRSMVPKDLGMEALRRLGEPDDGSRSRDFEGRRMIRVDGGYVILNYATYRDRDHTAAARQKRYRDNKRNGVTLLSNAVTSTGNTVTARNITQAEAEVEAEEKSTSTRARENSQPTAAGLACLLMRQAGCAMTNPSNPDLLAALAEGVSAQALADTVREAIEAKKQKPFSWAIQVARSRHAAGPTQRPQPTRPTPPPRREPTKIEKRTGTMVNIGEKIAEVLGKKKPEPV
jgi:hypothetical protein